MPSFDVVVFGATSFVGQIITQHLFEQYGVDGPLKWAIAGRSVSKLTALRDRLGQTAAGLSILNADARSVDDLRQLCNKTNVVLSTVGPYALYGEPLVRACAETGTDYCDLTGEVHWIRQMMDRYESKAQQTGARLVPCCGYDSIPSDMGLYFLQQRATEQFGTTCSSVNMRVKAAKGGASGGTFTSMLNLAKEASTDADLRKALADPYLICPPVMYERPKQSPVMTAQFDNDSGSWMAPFIMAAINERVVQRSNALLRYHNQFTYTEAMLTGKGTLGRLGATAITASIAGFLLAASIRPLRSTLQLFLPKPGEGPSPEAQRQGFFIHNLYGHTASGQRITVRVSGDRDPGYGSTAKMITQAGVCLAQDIPKQDKPGGFYTPASLMGNQLIDRLQQYAGITFEVKDLD